MTRPMLFLSACKTTTVPRSVQPLHPQAPSPGADPATYSPSPKARRQHFVLPMKKNVHMKYAGAGNEFAEYRTYVDYLSETLSNHN